MSLPSSLLQALQQELEQDREALLRAVEELSARYRGEASPRGGRFASTRAEVLAYAAARLPATFAAVQGVFLEAAERLHRFSPGTLLDLGAGPATAAWAALAVWPDIQRVVLVEREPEMIRLGRRLAAAAPHAALREAAWMRLDVAAGVAGLEADLVVASYVLGELGPGTVAALVEQAWRAAREVLVLVEPGTPAGFRRIAAARERLIQLGAFVAAPCPHQEACPLGEGDWCHFARRVQRSRLHRQLKGGKLAYEDEKYSYLVASKRPAAPARGRVIRRPRAHKGHVELDLCTPGGVERLVVSRKAGALYRWARKAQWGSAFENEKPRNGNSPSGA
ncbi:MAG: rRNA methyltransferase [Firmicutes bacterium]|nr:rRNA methyltransferase [Bacillota bacterium]MBO2521075.1 rRNA methyltransferase [Bacillota bacterium]